MNRPVENSGAGSPGRTRSKDTQYALALAHLIAEGRLRAADLGVTARGKVDGTGAQAMAAISAMMTAQFLGCRYLHSPFISMSHEAGEREDWARRWEAFLNFGGGETLVPEGAELVSQPDLIENPDAYAGRPIVITQRAFGLSRPLGDPIRERLRAPLREKYWRSGKAAIRAHRAPTGFTAAIHLRRGDVNAANHPSRYRPDAAMLRDIDRLRRAIAPFGWPLTVNLYSEGVAEDFAAFAHAGCNLHISTDTFESFHNMVTADILLGANSSFSYLAAMLSRGIVLDHRTRPPRLSGWLRRRADDEISIKRLRRALLGRANWLERGVYRLRLWQERLAG